MRRGRARRSRFSGPWISRTSRWRGGSSGREERRVSHRRQEAAVPGTFRTADGSGLGVKAYAVIEQGRIGQILSARPTERRQLLEEAAGITKYKVRRRTAELKLEAAQQNLTRVDDIIFEVERQRSALKRQAAKARRYRRLRDELRKWQKVTFARRSRRLTSAIETAGRCLDEAATGEQSGGGRSGGSGERPGTPDASNRWSRRTSGGDDVRENAHLVRARDSSGGSSRVDFGKRPPKDAWRAAWRREKATPPRARGAPAYRRVTSWGAQHGSPRSVRSYRSRCDARASARQPNGPRGRNSSGI